MRKALIVIVFMLCFVFGCEKKEVNANRFFVTFDSDGGTNVKQQVVEEGRSAVIPNEPTKTGYTFSGWYLDNKLYNFTDKVEKDIHLIARWEEKITICNNTCKKDYELDKNCNCVKKNTTTTTTKKTTTKTVKKDTLTLNEKNITLVEGQKTYIEAVSNNYVSWKSSDESIAVVNNGFIKGIKSGVTTVVVSDGNTKVSLIVNVISPDRERLEAVLSLIKPKIITKSGTSLAYSYNSCNITNNANITSSSEIKINEGIVSIGNIKDGTILSSYSVVCGKESENITVEHIVKQSIE